MKRRKTYENFLTFKTYRRAPRLRNTVEDIKRHVDDLEDIEGHMKLRRLGKKQGSFRRHRSKCGNSK